MYSMSSDIHTSCQYSNCSFSVQLISNSTWCSLSHLNCPTCFPTMTAFATTFRPSHEIIYINDHATRTTRATTRTTRNSWSTMCRGGGSKVSLKLWSRSFPMRDSISCSNFSKASANAGRVVRNLQGFADLPQSCSISIHFIPSAWGNRKNHKNPEGVASLHQ